MNRIDKHVLRKQRVAAKLRRMGLSVRSVASAQGYDFLVNDHVRVTLRVAFPSKRLHRVKAGKRIYEYRYPTWHFNFHHHGRLDEQYTDHFVCVAVRPRRRVQEDAFVLPWGCITGKTFSLHGGRSAYTGRYAPFLGAWNLIAEDGKRFESLRRVA